MVAKEVEADGIRRADGKQVGEEDHVAERLAHLVLTAVEHAGVHPEADERLAGQAFGLGDLRLVVREHEVPATAVDREAVAQVLHAHRRAFDVPARPALAPRGWPRRLAVFLRLPEDEIERVVLQWVGREVATLVGKLELRDIREPAEVAEPGVVLHVEINVAVGGISATFREKPFDDLDNVGNVLCRARFVFGWEVVQVLHVCCELGVLAVAEFFPVHLVGASAQKNIVIDVSHVADVRHFPSEEAQVTDKDIEGSVGKSVAQVSSVVGGDAADIDADALVGKRLLFAGKSVVEDGIRHARDPFEMRQRACGHPARHRGSGSTGSRPRPDFRSDWALRSLGTSGRAATRRAGFAGRPSGYPRGAS